MSGCHKLAVFASALLILAAPLFGAAAEARTRTKAHHRHFVNGPLVAGPFQPTVRRSPDGALIDSQGWRYWNGQWDNTCFRTLDYLSSSSACTGGGTGRR
jgi:hypothetical protein